MMIFTFPKSIESNFFNNTTRVYHHHSAWKNETFIPGNTTNNANEHRLVSYNDNTTLKVPIKFKMTVMFA